MIVDACPAAADSRSVRQCGEPVRVCHSILLFSNVLSARLTCTSGAVRLAGATDGKHLQAHASTTWAAP